MAQRSTKRQRANYGGAYHDAVPIADNDFSSVQFREGRMRRVGNTVFTAISEPSYQHDTSCWNDIVDWNIPDDPDYALDPNSDLYDELLKGDVIQAENPLPDSAAKRERSRVSVSSSTFCPVRNSLIHCIEAAPCSMERSSSRRLSGRSNSMGRQRRLSHCFALSRLHRSKRCRA